MGKLPVLFRKTSNRYRAELMEGQESHQHDILTSSVTVQLVEPGLGSAS